MKRNLSLALSAFLAVALQGCFLFDEDLRYHGEYSELYTEAIHSLLGVKGYIDLAETTYSAEIEIVEKDEHGRILFSYKEGCKGICDLLIAQKSDSDYVYYYPDFNFISRGSSSPVFSTQAILELKDKNDWSRPLDDSKFIKQKITRIKADYGLSENNMKKIFKEATGYDDACSATYLTSDEQGKKLFYCKGWPSNGVTHLAIITNADGTFDLATCFIILPDIYNYQHELKVLKELNSWKY